jgi:hypothetical protein
VLDYLSGNDNIADTALQASIETLTLLVHSDPQNSGWRRDLVRSLLVAAYFSAQRGIDQSSWQRLDASTEYLNQLMEDEPDVLETQELAIFSELCRARISDAETARELADNALQRLQSRFLESNDPRILELKAMALDQAGQVEASMVVEEQLHAIGYSGVNQRLGTKPG